MTLTRKGHEGYLMVDHRASPGLPEDIARQVGYDPALAGEGKVLEMATLTCCHCGTSYVKNHFRTRERIYCEKCVDVNGNMKYVCDGCAAAMRSPGYVHRSIDELVEMVGSGKWALSGSMTSPILTPTTEKQDGKA